jgi:4-hydroxybenzoyl-CoA thioesterase/acyl-CoA thioester hydrolase
LDYPFSTKRSVQFCDTDAGGIMHFTAYFRYMEQAEHEMLRQLGLSIFHEIDGQMISWPRVSTACEFKKPAVCEDELTIQIGIDRLGTKSVTYMSEFSRDGELLARGRIVAACCRVDVGHSPVAVQIPAQLVSKLQPMLLHG